MAPGKKHSKREPETRLVRYSKSENRLGESQVANQIRYGVVRKGKEGGLMGVSGILTLVLVENISNIYEGNTRLPHVLRKAFRLGDQIDKMKCPGIQWRTHRKS